MSDYNVVDIRTKMRKSSKAGDGEQVWTCECGGQTFLMVATPETIDTEFVVVCAWCESRMLGMKGTRFEEPKPDPVPDPETPEVA